jgi:hypothetical protein
MEIKIFGDALEVSLDFKVYNKIDNQYKRVRYRI